MRKTGSEPLVFAGEPVGFSIRDFWSWAYSDLLDNTLRGSYAEFIVATALGVDLTKGRTSWDPWDLTFNDIRVEVKSSSYIQSWEQTRPSAISFSIRPTVSWSGAKGYSGDVKRQSDVYVFCVYSEQDASVADPLSLDSWEFYVIPTARLDERCQAQKTIALGSLLQLDPIRTDYAGLRDAVLSSV